MTKPIPSTAGKNIHLLLKNFLFLLLFVFIRLEDISVTMRQRAVDGYGLEADFKPDSELMQDLTTRELWCWVDTCRKLAQSGNPLGIHFLGIRYQ